MTDETANTPELILKRLNDLRNDNKFTREATETTIANINAMTSKYEPATLPTKQTALIMATEREAWAKAARERDQPGSAKEFELTALLLRFYAEHIDAGGASELSSRHSRLSPDNRP